MHMGYVVGKTTVCTIMQCCNGLMCSVQGPQCTLESSKRLWTFNAVKVAQCNIVTKCENDSTSILYVKNVKDALLPLVNFRKCRM